MLYQNKFDLTGNVSQAPKQMATAGQTSRVCLSIAQNVLNNKKEEEVRYYQIWFWGENADKILEQASVGDHLYINGWLKPEQYTKDNVQVNSMSLQGIFFINYGRRAKKEGNDTSSEDQKNYT